MLIKALFLATAILFGVTAAVCPVQDQDNVELTPSKFMMRKLDYSRDIVHGLATEDYEKITQAAQKMLVLSHEADWNVITTKEYLKMSTEFRETTERLRERGREKNLDGATLAYFEMTLSCMRCHKSLRATPTKK